MWHKGTHLQLCWIYKLKRAVLHRHCCNTGFISMWMENISEVEKGTIVFKAVSFNSNLLQTSWMSACFEGGMSLKPHASSIKCPPEQNKNLAHSYQQPHGRQPDTHSSVTTADLTVRWLRISLSGADWTHDNGDIFKHHLVPSHAVHVIQTWVLCATTLKGKNLYHIM